ncbi:MAG: hypothetical protein PHP14_01565 [Candidatus Pacebacteria bacterium]|nr:hypothetical protein [Candidatus Paceibacterota bacterium]
MGRKAIKSAIIDITNANNGFFVIYQTSKEITTINKTTISDFDLPPMPFFIDNKNIKKFPTKIAEANQTAFLSPCANKVATNKADITAIKNHVVLCGRKLPLKINLIPTK